MRAFTKLVLTGLGAWALAGIASGQSFAPCGTTQPRLTIFEGFYNTNCPICVTAGQAVDQLATEYASRPVVFLEDSVVSPPPKGDRISRYYAKGVASYFPFIMVNSGHEVTNGPQTDQAAFVAKYKAMVDAEMARPALVEMFASYQRIGNLVRIYVDVVNTTSVTLSSSTFPTWVHGIVWEEARVTDTNRYVRAAMVTPVAGIAPGKRASFILESPELTGVNWEKLHVLALADYRPGGVTGSSYDMLQAVVAVSPTFTISPTTFSCVLPQGSPSAEVRFAGPSVLQWSALPHEPWLSVTPTSGPLSTPALVTVDRSKLPTGEHAGSVTFAATGDGLSFQAELPVTATNTLSTRMQELPGVASDRGSNDTVWRSSATLHNPGTSPFSVRLEIIPRDRNVVTASKELTLAAGEVRQLANLYQELNAPSGTGTLRVTGDALAWVRTFNQATSGTFGQDLVGTAEVVYAPNDRLLFPIFTASKSSDFRSNLLLLNLDETSNDVNVTSGSKSKLVPVPPRTYLQVSGIGGALGLPAGPAVITVQATGRWVGYVSTVDGVTGDPTTVRGQKVVAP